MLRKKIFFVKYHTFATLDACAIFSSGIALIFHLFNTHVSVSLFKEAQCRNSQSGTPLVTQKFYTDPMLRGSRVLNVLGEKGDTTHLTCFLLLFLTGGYQKLSNHTGSHLRSAHKFLWSALVWTGLTGPHFHHFLAVWPPARGSQLGA